MKLEGRAGKGRVLARDESGMEHEETAELHTIYNSAVASCLKTCHLTVTGELTAASLYR